MRYFSFLLASFFAAATCFSQPVNFYISGTVISRETNLPMAGASVFAQNTTFGTVTNAEGKFSLQLPAGGYEIAVTFTGYATETKRITSSEGETRNLTFELKQKEKEMEAVSVVATTEVKNGYEKYGPFFLDHFIGRTANSSACSITNPEVLKFFYSKKRNRLKVTATEPLIIVNKALGYNIRYSLDSFTHAYETQVSLYTGYPLFEEMGGDSLQHQQWVTERHKAYKGSLLHFMRSIYHKELKEEGFEIQFLISYNSKDTTFIPKNIYTALNYQKDDSTQTVEFRPNQQMIGVLYTKEKPAAGFLAENKQASEEFQFSILNFAPGQSVIIEQNGYYFEQTDISISEYWTWDKVADQLPYDYVPLKL